MESRITELRGRIAAALSRSGREAGATVLVAVTKTIPPGVVADAARAGLSVFGENRVQEAAAKIPAAADLAAGRPLAWHLVGHLQSNKARQAAKLFDLIHSVDDAQLARRLDAAGAELGKRQAILVQVSVAGESSKSGVSPGDLRELIEAAAALPHVELRGLMTIPPYDLDPEKSRPHFARLRELGIDVAGWVGADRYPGELSMGMSEDFEVAIQEGATLVRIGRALFGERSG